MVRTLGDKAKVACPAAGGPAVQVTGAVTTAVPRSADSVVVWAKVLFTEVCAKPVPSVCAEAGAKVVAPPPENSAVALGTGLPQASLATTAKVVVATLSATSNDGAAIMLDSVALG